MILTSIKEQAINMDEVVTRRILADEFTKFEKHFEIKMERMIELKIHETFTQRFEEQERRFERNMGAWMENLRHEMKATAEGITMHIEASERRWKEQGGLNGMMNNRLNRLESEFLTA